VQLAILKPVDAARAAVVVFLAALVSCPCAHAAPQQPRMGIFTKKGAMVGMQLPFVDEQGAPTTLGAAALAGKPFILAPIFYRCPRLCGLTFGGIIELVRSMKLRLGEDYSVVSYSFNPSEGPAEAREKRAEILEQLRKKGGSAAGWSFLTASAATIEAINRELDFRVRYADRELEHSSAIFIVSPSGEVRRYFAGVEFSPEKVSAALLAP